MKDFSSLSEPCIPSYSHAIAGRSRNIITDVQELASKIMMHPSLEDATPSFEAFDVVKSL